MVADERREPPQPVARLGAVGGDVARGGHLDAEPGRIAARLAQTLAHALQAPLDEERVRDLEDHAVCDPPGKRERLRPVGGDEDGDLASLRPLEPDRMAVDLDLVASRQPTDDPDGVLQVGQCPRPGAADPDGAVAPADAADQPIAADHVRQRREEARDNRRIAGDRVRHAGADDDRFCLDRDQGHLRRVLLHQDVRVPAPDVRESAGLRELGFPDLKVGRRVGWKADPEVHRVSAGRQWAPPRCKRSYGIRSRPECPTVGPCSIRPGRLPN